MDKQQAKNLIEKTFNNKFNKEQYAKFAMNLLDGLNVEKQFTRPNAYIKESFRNYIESYGRIGKYVDAQGNDFEVLWVNLKKETALDRARTMQRNFIAWYLNGGVGDVIRHNAVVAFYNEELPDWRFSFVKLETDLAENEKGQFKAINKFTAAKRYSFLVGEQEPNHTAQSRLIDVLTKEKPVLSDIEEAFNIEKVSKEFFALYKELFLELVENLKEIRANDGRINHEFTLKQVSEANFCKKLMGQIVFLYFIQKKGWLGVHKDGDWGTGPKDFLRQLFNKAMVEGKNFFNDYLEPLFYEALATARDEDYYNPFDCKIPFLNGGLFEAINEYSWGTTDIIIPNEVFSNTVKTKNSDAGTGILDVFDRYNFTVKEDEPLEKEVAVDPEMLGKVFEELLEVTDRKSKGAFYTPREIVHYMCQESLINYLTTALEGKIEKQDISDFIHYGDIFAQNEVVARAKEKAGIKDTKYEYELAPSIRKFAKDIDEKLENIRICDPAIGSGAFPVGMMNEIVRARITLLETDYINATKQKNPYEYKRQAIQNCIYGVDIDAGAIEIAKLRLWLSLVVDEDDIKSIKPLPNLDYKIVCGNSLLGVERNLFNDFHLKTLEELKPKYFAESNKRQKKEYKKQIDQLIQELTKDGSFDFEIYFSEVFHEKGGFDVVIGNPPYVQLSKTNISQQYKDYLLSKYQTSCGRLNTFGFFILEGINNLRNTGNLAYIIPNTILTQEYYECLRYKILTTTNILNLVNYEKMQFNEAVVENITLILRKTETPSQEVNINLQNKTEVLKLSQINQSKFLCNYKYSFNINENPLCNKIQQKTSFHKLGELCNINQAIALKGDKSKSVVYSPIDDNAEYYKLLDGRNINKYSIKWTGEYLLYDVDKIHSCKTKAPFLATEKLMFRRVSRDLIFTYDDNNYFALNTIVVVTLKQNIKSKIKYLLSLLNSKLLNYFYKNNFKSTKTVFSEIQARSVGLIPVPIIKIDSQEEFVNRVDKILELIKQEDYQQSQEKQAQVKKYQDNIDLMVYKLYELDYTEVLTIDPDFKMSETEYNNYYLPVGEVV
jgi:hypothetical protein